MGTRITILLFSLLLLAIARPLTAHVQTPLPADKKKAMHKIDPVDIFPEARESGRDKGRKNPGPNAESAAPKKAAPASAAASESAQRKVNHEKSPTPASPSPTAAAHVTKALPTPTAEPAVAVARPASSPIVSATPQAPTKPSSVPPTEPVSTPAVMGATQSSDPLPTAPSSPTTANQSGHSAGLSLPVIFTLLGLILLALVVVVVNLRKQLRTPQRGEG